ncbi:MAG: OmpA family protein [Bacteroidota bacterium]|jgi:outer membrane protein OmpA-like peptidoglycan-associated protein
MRFRKLFYLFIAMTLVTFHGIAQDKSANGNDAVFNFTVTSKSGKPRQGELILLKSKKTKKVYQGNTGADGKCSVGIPPSDAYTIYYKLFADTVKYREIDVPGEDHKVTYTLTLKYDPPKVYTLKNVFFETGLSSIKKESWPALDELVSAMKSKPALCIEIAGHTDNVGKPEANQKLSEDRANAVRDYLVKHGIEVKRVTAKGFGETQPVASNDTAEGRQQNRRTEVRITSE